MALVGLGLATANLDLALGGAALWGVDAGCVLIGGGSIMALKRALLHRGRAVRG